MGEYAYRGVGVGVVRRICLLGLPGAGKTSLARALGGAFTWRVVSIGEAVRRSAQNETALAAQLATGALAPEDLVTRIVEDAVQGAPMGSLVIDGFPRHPAQIAEANRVLQNWVPLLVDVDPTTALQRLVTRGKCPSCGLPAPSDADAPTEICPRCNAPSPVRRDEDSPAVVTRRLAEATARLEALLHAIAIEKRPILRVNARDPLQVITAQAIALLDPT
jgi:adenylate kinase family enzyme